MCWGQCGLRKYQRSVCCCSSQSKTTQEVYCETNVLSAVNLTGFTIGLQTASKTYIDVDLSFGDVVIDNDFFRFKMVWQEVIFRIKVQWLAKESLQYNDGVLNYGFADSVWDIMSMTWLGTWFKLN